jgi:hypothetical protein
MKRLLNIPTQGAQSGPATQSLFFELYTKDEPGNEQIIVKFLESTKMADGEWSRDYVMKVLPKTILAVFHTVGGVRKPLLRGGLPVTVDEFTLMRFLIWDNAFTSLKNIISSAIQRRKLADAAKAQGLQPAPYEFDLPSQYPAADFLAYLDNVYEVPTTGS